MAQLLGQVSVGSVVKINENGSPTNYIVVNQGIPGNSPLYDASCNGTWLLRQDIPFTSNFDGYVNNYANSSAKNNMNAFSNAYDPDIQAKVVNAIIPYCVGGGSSTVNSGSNGVSVKCFLLSAYELGYTDDIYPGFPEDGYVLSYFSSAYNQQINAIRKANYNGSTTEWWTRSPYTGNSNQVFSVSKTGGYKSWNSTATAGRRPAVIFPRSMLVMDDGSLSASVLPPTLTVPSQAMQGQSIPITWTASANADSYQLQRKADSGEWETIYTGSDLTFTDTAGSWNTVQYQVAAGLSGEYGEYATSAVIPVISASALVISGSDTDLGTITADIPYTVSSDTGNQITLTRTVNGVQYASATVSSGFAYNIPVMELPTGTGTIVITASVQAASGPVTATRTWTYTKTAQTFPASAGVGPLAQNGASFLPQTLAECVRTNSFWGGSLSTALEMLTGVAANGAQIEVGSYTGTGTSGSSNPNSLTFSFSPKLLVISGSSSNQYVGILAKNAGFMTSLPPGGAGDYTRGVNMSLSENTISWYSIAPEYQLNLSGVSYQYFAIG